MLTNIQYNRTLFDVFQNNNDKMILSTILSQICNKTGLSTKININSLLFARILKAKVFFVCIFNMEIFVNTHVLQTKKNIVCSEVVLCRARVS